MALLRAKIKPPLEVVVADWGSTEASQEMLDATSIEKNVTPDATVAYIVHTSNDDVVNVKNTLALAKAYAETSLTFELHIYPNGSHGMALGNRITEQCQLVKTPCQRSNPKFQKFP